MKNTSATIACQNTVRIWGSSLCFLLLCLLQGCDSIQIRELPAGWDSFAGVTSEEKAARPWAYVKSLRALYDGAEYNLDAGFVTRVRNNLRDTNLFEEVVFEKPMPIFPYVEINIVMKEAWVENRGLNFAKMMLAAVTLGALAPVMVGSAEYECDVEVKVWRPDDQARQYVAHSSGEARSSLDLHKQKMALLRRVVTNSLNSVVSQLVTDREFYRMIRPDSGRATKPPI